MDYVTRINKILETNNGIITANEVRENNIPTIYLSRLEKAGHISRISNGIYINDNGDYDEYYLLNKNSKRIIFSYLSSLYLNYFTDIIPQQMEVSVPSGYNRHRIKEDVIVHFVKPEVHQIGITEVETIFGNIVKAYNIERTICDFINNRESIDKDVFGETIRNYAKFENKDMDKLYSYADKMDILEETLEIFEVIYE